VFCKKGYLRFAASSTFTAQTCKDVCVEEERQMKFSFLSLGSVRKSLSLSDYILQTAARDYLHFLWDRFMALKAPIIAARRNSVQLKSC
jgi:hypothetical protein